MEDSLNEIKVDNKRTTNFRKWSFRLFVDLVFVNGLIFYHLATSAFPQPFVILIFSVLSLVFFIGGSVLLVLSIKNNEQKNYQYWISAVGFPLYLVLSVVFYLATHFK